MTPEYRLKLLEEEARHETAMRRIQGERLDIHDSSIETIQGMLNTVGQRLDEITVIQQQNAVQVAQLTTLVQDLVRAITHTHTNGKEPPK